MTRPTASIRYFPREHGATAMLLTPFFSAAILLRHAQWTEAVALVAAFCAFAAKDPLVVLVRQRLVWHTEHPETRAARRWLAVELLVMASSGVVLILAAPWPGLALLALGALGFGILAVWINLRNRQRSPWFQVATAAALTSTSLLACVSVTGTVPPWGWTLWLLCALQASAGIFAVHARLDARINLRTGNGVRGSSRRAAFWSIGALVAAAAAFWRSPWIAAALSIAAAVYAWELRRQQDAEALRMALARVGIQSLALSLLYAALIVVGLW